MRCVIFGAAPITDYAYYRDKISDKDFVICADGGLKHAEAIGRNPDLILGDFDSYREKVSHQEVVFYPSEKDDTDMGLAVKYALTHGMKELCIFGGLNGRLDHTIANIHLLKYALDCGARAYLMDENMFVTVFEGEYAIRRNEYKYISALPFGGSVTGITYEGLKYPLKNAVFETGDPYGVSNEMILDTAKMTIQSGTMLLIMTKDIG